MTVFNTGPHANTTDFRAGDVGLVRRNCGHYVENTGDDDLVFIETFRSDHYEEVSLANWLAHLPPKLVTAHLNIPGRPSRSSRAPRRESCRCPSRGRERPEASPDLAGEGGPERGAGPRRLRRRLVLVRGDQAPALGRNHRHGGAESADLAGGRCRAHPLGPGAAARTGYPGRSLVRRNGDIGSRIHPAVAALVYVAARSPDAARTTRRWPACSRPRRPARAWSTPTGSAPWPRMRSATTSRAAWSRPGAGCSTRCREGCQTPSSRTGRRWQPGGHGRPGTRSPGGTGRSRPSFSGSWPGGWRRRPWRSRPATCR